MTAGLKCHSINYERFLILFIRIFALHTHTRTIHTMCDTHVWSEPNSTLHQSNQSEIIRLCNAIYWCSDALCLFVPSTINIYYNYFLFVFSFGRNELLSFRYGFVLYIFHLVANMPMYWASSMIYARVAIYPILWNFSTLIDYFLLSPKYAQMRKMRGFVRQSLTECWFCVARVLKTDSS